MAALRIGGVRVNCSGGFVESLSTQPSKRKHQKKGGRRREIVHQRQGGGDDPDNADELAMQDYFENLLADAEVSSGDEEESEVDAEAEHAFERSEAAEMGSGPRVEDVVRPGEPLDATDSSSLADSEDNDTHSDSPCISDVIEDFSQQLQLHAQFPVQVIGQARPGEFIGTPVLGKRSSVESPGKKARLKKKLFEQSRKVGDRKTGPWLPLTKRQLKRQRLEGVQERRRCMAAIRELDRLDLGRINKQLHTLVKTDGDIEAFPPMLRYGRACICQLASIYRLASSEQGSKGKKAFVVVRTTPRSRLPQGDDKARLDGLLRQFKEAAAAPKAAAAVGAAAPPPTSQKAAPGFGKAPPGLFRAKQTAQVSRLSARPSGKKRLQQPVGFVASGCLNDAEPEGVVVVNPLANRHQGRQHNPPSHGALGATLPGNSRRSPMAVDGRSVQDAARPAEDSSGARRPSAAHGPDPPAAGLGGLPAASAALQRWPFGGRDYTDVELASTRPWCATAAQLSKGAAANGAAATARDSSEEGWQPSFGNGSASSSVHEQASMEPQPMQDSAGLGMAVCEQMIAEPQLPPGLGRGSAARQPDNAHFIGLQGRCHQGEAAVEQASSGRCPEPDIRQSLPMDSVTADQLRPGLGFETASIVAGPDNAAAFLNVFEDRCQAPSGSAANFEYSQEPVYEAFAVSLEARCQPSLLRTKAQCRNARKKVEKEQRRAAKREIAAGQAAPPPAAPTVTATALQYGEFEKHTRGVGSKIMAQMGYAQGAGLGRDRQGMAEPLRAVIRPRNLGLGA